MTRYVPAVLPDGDVPLSSALAFIALAEEVTEAALLAQVDELVSADTSAPGLQRSTVADHVAEIQAPARSVLTGYELYRAVVHDADADGRPWAPRFAAVMVWAEADGAPGSDGAPPNHRPVTEAEVVGQFPTRAFAGAWSPFYEASAALTSGLLGTPSGSASSSAGATATTTPA